MRRPWRRTWPVKVGRDSGHVDPLAKIVVPRFSKPLEEHRDALLGRWLPVLVDQPPEVVRQSILLGERHVDHRQRGTLALIDAGEEERDDGVLDIGPVEMRRNGGAKPGQRRGEIR